MRHQLAEFDTTILTDIGVASDEIYGVRARQDFIPRSWRDRFGFEPAARSTIKVAQPVRTCLRRSLKPAMR